MNVGKNNLAAKLNSDRLFGQLIVGGTLQLRNGGIMDMAKGLFILYKINGRLQQNGASKAVTEIILCCTNGRKGSSV